MTVKTADVKQSTAGSVALKPISFDDSAINSGEYGDDTTVEVTLCHSIEGEGCPTRG